jgi:hypothetical protein
VLFVLGLVRQVPLAASDTLSLDEDGLWNLLPSKMGCFVRRERPDWEKPLLGICQRVLCMDARQTVTVRGEQISPSASDLSWSWHGTSPVGEGGTSQETYMGRSPTASRSRTHTAGQR